MSTNTNTMRARFAEVAAVSSAEQIVKGLHTLILEPTGKQFNRQRAARGERWQQLALLAAEQAKVLASEPPNRRAPRAKASVEPLTPLPLDVVPN